MKHKALTRNDQGFSHVVLATLLVVAMAIIGVLTLVASHADSSTPSFVDNNAGRAVARNASHGNTHVSYALVGEQGHVISSYEPNAKNYGASITKSLLLITYLRRAGSAQMNSEARSKLTSMIVNSDNDAANWAYHHIDKPDKMLKATAKNVHLSGFSLDTSDPVYVLGQSKVTARGLATFFARIHSTPPGPYHDFALDLLAGVQPRSGFLQAGLPGRLFAKEGWKPEPSNLPGAPYIVNQAVQFQRNGQHYGLAITIRGTSDQASGEAIAKHLAEALIH